MTSTLPLPFSLEDLEHRVISFVTPDNEKRFCLIRKANWYKLESHRRILEHSRVLDEHRSAFDQLLKAVRPLMQDNAELLLREALEYSHRGSSRM